jgi:hypothetical protein
MTIIQAAVGDNAREQDEVGFSNAAVVRSPCKPFYYVYTHLVLSPC